MIGGRHAETYCGGGEKGAECKDVNAGGGGVAGREHRVNINTDNSEGEGAE